jgi:phosphodiesterase/alkaline phosphatase D-like protein
MPIFVLVFFRRRATQTHYDGLLNMRRRAPMLGTWDDHETNNNAYGMGAEENVSRSME